MTKKPGGRPTYAGLKLALASGSLLTSLLGARLLARADASAQEVSAPAQQPVVMQPVVVVVRRYVEVTPAVQQPAPSAAAVSPAPVSNPSGESATLNLPPIPTAIPYTAPPAPVARTRSS